MDHNRTERDEVLQKTNGLLSLREKQTKQCNLFARNWNGGRVTM